MNYPKRNAAAEKRLSGQKRQIANLLSLGGKNVGKYTLDDITPNPRELPTAKGASTRN